MKYGRKIIKNHICNFTWINMTTMANYSMHKNKDNHNVFKGQDFKTRFVFQGGEEIKPRILTLTLKDITDHEMGRKNLLWFLFGTQQKRNPN